MTSPSVRQKRESPDRLVLFTDAVVAIALTLLAIDLPVPAGGSEHAFFQSVRDNLGHYLAFIVSFVVVAVAWRNHKRLNVVVAKVDTTFESLNFVWLLTVVLLPFAAKLLTLRNHPPLLVHACCFGLYSLIEAVASGTIVVMLRHAQKHGQLEPDVEEERSALQWGTGGVAVGFALSIPIFFVTYLAWIFWFAGPMAVNLIHRLLRSRLPQAG
jgi:uncharacterized membrane protein